MNKWPVYLLNLHGIPNQNPQAWTNWSMLLLHYHPLAAWLLAIFLCHPMISHVCQVAVFVRQPLTITESRHVLLAMIPFVSKTMSKSSVGQNQDQCGRSCCWILCKYVAAQTVHGFPPNLWCIYLYIDRYIYIYTYAYMYISIYIYQLQPYNHMDFWIFSKIQITDTHPL